MEASIFGREFSRALTKTDIFRLLYMASEHFSIGSFLLLDIEVALANGLERAVIFEACPAATLQAFLSSKNPERSLEKLAAEKYTIWSQGDEQSSSLLASFRAKNVVTLTVRTISGSCLMLILVNCGSFYAGHEFTRQMIEFRDIVSRYVDVAVPDPGNSALSEKELEVARWTARGKNSDEIAHGLGLSQYAVNDYLSEAMKKMEASSRIHLVAKCIRLGLI